MANAINVAAVASWETPAAPLISSGEIPARALLAGRLWREARNLLGARFMQFFRVDRYGRENWCNPLCRQDYRKFLKFVGPSYRNYLSDGPVSGGSYASANRHQESGSQGGACRHRPTLVIETGPVVRPGHMTVCKPLPACPCSDFARLVLRTGSIDWFAPIGVGQRAPICDGQTVLIDLCPQC